MGLEAMTAETPSEPRHPWGSDYLTFSGTVESGPKSCVGRRCFFRLTRLEAARLGAELTAMAARKEAWPDPFGSIVK